MKKGVKKPAPGARQSGGQAKKGAPKKELPQISWFNHLLFKFWPRMGLRYFTRKMGIDDSAARQAHGLFSDVAKIDIFPSVSGYRGFVLILDRKTSLYFYQDGDHFKYDGYEMGEYKKGDVTLFDRVETRKEHRF